MKWLEDLLWWLRQKLCKHDFFKDICLHCYKVKS